MLAVRLRCGVTCFSKEVLRCKYEINTATDDSPNQNSESLQNSQPLPATTNKISPQVIDAAEHPAVAAFKAGTLGFGFSGGGFLLPYFLGVVEAFKQTGILHQRSLVAGSSAGSLIAAGISCGLSVDTMLSTYRAIAQDCSEKGTHGRLGIVLQQELQKLLPEDAHHQCHSFAHIGITKLLPYPKFSLHSDFSDRQDAISALLASCHIPIISNSKLTTKHGKHTVVDGGITNIIPCPPGAQYTIKISCFPSQHLPKLPVLNKKQALANLAFSPDHYQTWPYDFKQTVQYALAPGPWSVAEELIAAGHRDAMIWAGSVGLIAAAKQHTQTLAAEANAAALFLAQGMSEPAVQQMACGTG